MHICIWHGYQLRGTGSNVYVRNVAAQAVRAGHRISLFCQEDDPVSLPFVDRAYDLDDANQALVPIAGGGEAAGSSCTVYRPNLGGHLPVYVYDRYERFPRVTEMPDLPDADIEEYIRRNVAALETVFDENVPDLVLTNHAVLSPEIARRAFGGSVRKVSILHGSALNYSVRNDVRLHRLAVSGLRDAAAVVVVSEGSGERARQILGADLPELDHVLEVIPCGVDIDLFRILPTGKALTSLGAVLEGASGLPVDLERTTVETFGTARTGEEMVAAADAVRGTYEERKPDAGALRKIMELDPDRGGLVVYTGKLIVSKGVHVLLLALPEFLAGTDVRVLLVGFGTYREGLTMLLQALARGDAGALRAVADLGRRLEGGEESPLHEMTAFLDEMERSGELEAYLETARTCGLEDRVRFTGILEHDALSRVHALADLAVVPSIFPEAFGMVGVEAMACGALPVLTRQGGLADLIDILGEELGEDLAAAVSVDPAPERMVRSLARALPAALALVRRRPGLKEELSRITVGRFGWGPVGDRLLAAGGGRT